MHDLVKQYVKFTFDEYAKDPRGWITKTPPSVAEFAEMLNNITAGKLITNRWI